MLWFKTFHIISFVAWFSGLFYLPRLFVYHSMSDDEISLNRFQTMEKKLYRVIMWPAALATVLLGFSLLLYNPSYYLQSGWMHAKLGLVVMLIGYHIHCGFLIRGIQTKQTMKSTRYYRIYNEIPTVLLLGIVMMVVVRPF